jgi:hypothetical protein
VIERLCEVLSSIPNTAKKKRGGVGEKVAQIIHTHVSECKNNKIKINPNYIVTHI